MTYEKAFSKIVCTTKKMYREPNRFITGHPSKTVVADELQLFIHDLEKGTKITFSDYLLCTTVNEARTEAKSAFWEPAIKDILSHDWKVKK